MTMAFFAFCFPNINTVKVRVETRFGSSRSTTDSRIRALPYLPLCRILGASPSPSPSASPAMSVSSGSTTSASLCRIFFQTSGPASDRTLWVCSLENKNKMLHQASVCPNWWPMMSPMQTNVEGARPRTVPNRSNAHNPRFIFPL